MRTLQINTMDKKGGAAKAAFRIYQGLDKLGEDSHMLVLAKSGVEQNIHSVITDFRTERKSIDKNYNLIQKFYIDSNRTEVSNSLYYFGYPGRDISLNPEVLASDVINLHMIDHLLTPVTLAKLGRLDKPLVWTLHDEYPYTGSYHYASGSTAHQNLKGQDIQLDDDPFQIAQALIKDRVQLWKKLNLTVVAPSEWIATQARSSLLFRDSRVEVIANGHPVDVFYPEEKRKAKHKLGLPEQGFTILFGAESGNEKRKGFDKITEVVSKLSQDESIRSLLNQHLLHCLVIGEPNKELSKLNIPVVTTGTIKDEDKMRWVYSAADVLLFTSLEENLSNILLESMACGVVPVAFNVGGNPDIIGDTQNGYLVELSNIALAVQRVKALLREGSELSNLSAKAVETVKTNFEQLQQARKYLDLYQDLVRDVRKKTTNQTPSPSSEISYELAPNIAKIYPDLIKYTKQKFATQIANSEPSRLEQYRSRLKKTLVYRAFSKIVRKLRN